jgi:hypothetical protein
MMAAMKTATKISLFALAALVATITFGSGAKAQNYPWCAFYDAGDEAIVCGFVSFEQCLATVRGIGGFCDRNNLYQAAVPVKHPAYRAHKDSSRKPS